MNILLPPPVFDVHNIHNGELSLKRRRKTWPKKHVSREIRFHFGKTEFLSVGGQRQKGVSVLINGAQITRVVTYTLGVHRKRNSEALKGPLCAQSQGENYFLAPILNLHFPFSERCAADDRPNVFPPSFSEKPPKESTFFPSSFGKKKLPAN